MYHYVSLVDTEVNDPWKLNTKIAKKISYFIDSKKMIIKGWPNRLQNKLE